MSMDLDFVAVDVETANADLASICQIGIATVQGSKVKDVWTQLVDPEDYFDPFNISIHGIDASMVKGSPKFKDVYKDLQDRFCQVVVSHTAFDRASISRACEHCNKPFPETTWLDSARIVRRAWPEKYAKRGYGLANVASDLGISFEHHDAGEDARAAAEIVIRASTDIGLDIEGWLQRVELPIRPDLVGRRRVESIEREGSSEGMFFGEVLVFTGALSIPRREAANLAAATGCEVDASITKNTSLLVVGQQNVGRLRGYMNSSKYRKAKALIKKGQNIRILREADFQRMISENVDQTNLDMNQDQESNPAIEKVIKKMRTLKKLLKYGRR